MLCACAARLVVMGYGRVEVGWSKDDSRFPNLSTELCSKRTQVVSYLRLTCQLGHHKYLFLS